MLVSVRLAQAVSFRVRETWRLQGAEREPVGQREDEPRQEGAWCILGQCACACERMCACVCARVHMCVCTRVCGLSRDSEGESDGVRSGMAGAG